MDLLSPPNGPLSAHRDEEIVRTNTYFGNPDFIFHTPMPLLPRVSVLMPAYNRLHVLPRAIASVVAQSNPDWELVIVDDGSSDGSVKLLREYARADPRIRFARQPRGGPAAARNRAFALAAGEYLACLDSDDEYLPTHLADRIAVLDAYPDIDFLHGGVLVVGNADDCYVPDARDTSARIHLDDCVVGGTFFSRRGPIELAEGWQAGYAEDFQLFERIRNRVSMSRVDFRTYVYHRESADSRCGHPGSIA